MTKSNRYVKRWIWDLIINSNGITCIAITWPCKSFGIGTILFLSMSFLLIKLFMHPHSNIFKVNSEMWLMVNSITCHLTVLHKHWTKNGKYAQVHNCQSFNRSVPAALALFVQLVSWMDLDVSAYRNWNSVYVSQAATYTPIG